MESISSLSRAVLYKPESSATGAQERKAPAISNTRTAAAMSSGDPPAVEMVNELEAWAAAFCDDGARHHAQQKEVMKLELDVECNPLSAQFSGRLYALMEQEEQAAQRGQTDAHARLSETVNVMMNQETKAHFDRQAEYSNKRWRAIRSLAGK